jgi:hypothetical protein
MTVSKFSEDTDARWTIALVALSVVLVLGWLVSIGGHKQESQSESSGTVHSNQ